MVQMIKLAVLGAGSWGTALAATFAGHQEVTLWGRDSGRMAAMARDRENRRYLPGCALPAALSITSDLAEALDGVGLVLVVTPVKAFRETLECLHALAPGVPAIWACKGLEAGSRLLPHQIFAQTLGAGAPGAVLTGPSFAAEVVRGLPTAITLASADIGLARQCAAWLHHPRFRIYAGDDVPGAEVGGAAKNVLAIAAGIADGMGFGSNARAALITRGLAEISRLGLALGGRRETLMGLAGMGDLILTCTGDLSRNRRVGLGLARGEPLAVVLEQLGQTAEGVSTAREVVALADQMGVEMPICAAVNQVLHHGLPARVAVEQLLARDIKDE